MRVVAGGCGGSFRALVYAEWHGVMDVFRFWSRLRAKIRWKKRKSICSSTFCTRGLYHRPLPIPSILRCRHSETMTAVAYAETICSRARLAFS